MKIITGEPIALHNRQNQTKSNDPPDLLTGKQLKAIAEILAAGTIEEAARGAEISKSTIYAWMKEPLSRARLEASREEVFAEGLGALKGATEKAAGKLIALLDTQDKTTLRLTAREILSLAFKIKEMQELESRIGNIEEILKDWMKWRGNHRGDGNVSDAPKIGGKVPLPD